MTRELKFRVWDGEYIVLIADISNDTCLHFYEDSWTAMDHFTGKHVEICNNKTGVLMQYTGVKDKNGKEIYEGDIIRCGYGFGEVIFHSGCFMVQWVDDKEADMEFIFSRNGRRIREGEDSFQVIGNIYETPDLLK